MHKTRGQIKRIWATILMIALVMGIFPSEFIHAKTNNSAGTLNTTVEINCSPRMEKTVNLYNGICPFTPDDTWSVEADIKTTELLEDASVGLKLDNQTGINVLGLSGDELTDGETCHFKYTIYRDGSVHVIVTSQNATIVDEVKQGYMFQVFEPQWVAKAGSYEISNVTVTQILDVEKAELEKVITNCKSVVTENYTKDSAEAFIDALENAQSVYLNEDSTKPNMINATVTLEEAYLALESVKTTLQIGGGDSHTESVTYEAIAGEKLPTGEIDGKYISGWGVDGKQVTTFKRDEVEALTAQFLDTKMLDINIRKVISMKITSEILDSLLLSMVLNIKR